MTWCRCTKRSCCTPVVKICFAKILGLALKSSLWFHHCSVRLRCNLFLENSLCASYKASRNKQQMETQMSGEKQHKKLGIANVLMFLFTGVKIKYYKAIMCEVTSRRRKYVHLQPSMLWPNQPLHNQKHAHHCVPRWSFTKSIIHGILFALQFLCMRIQNRIIVHSLN